MDTPGLRELQLWDSDEGISQTFSDIESLAANCRFGNCRHHNEPSCAVQAAIDAGELDTARLENWRKLERELAFLKRKIDPDARQNEKQRIKQLMRGVKKMYRDREKR
jgi:ribosome biogenesis GTPase